MVRMQDCINNRWKYGVGKYWGVSGFSSSGEAKIVVSNSDTSRCDGGLEKKELKQGASGYFLNNSYKVKVEKVYLSSKTVYLNVSTDIARPPSTTPPNETESSYNSNDFQFGGGSSGGGGFGDTWSESFTEKEEGEEEDYTHLLIILGVIVLFIVLTFFMG